MYATAQTGRPPAFAVHHTYGKEDGIPPGNAFTVMDQLDDGSVVARLYGKQFIRITPTGVKPIYVGSSFNGFLGTEVASTGSGKGIFQANIGGLLKLENDSLQAFGPRMHMNYAFALPSGKHLIWADSTSEALFYIFDGKKYHPLPLPKGLEKLRHNELYPLHNLPDGTARIGCKMKEGPLHILAYDEAQNTLKIEATYGNQTLFAPWRNFYADSLIIYDGGAFKMYYPGDVKKPRLIANRYQSNGSRHIESLAAGNYTLLKDYLPKGFGEIPITSTEMISYIQQDRFYNSFYLGMQTQLQRVFPHVKQYPYLYASANSLNTSNLAQTDDGTLFFGSYAGYLSILKNGAIKSIDVNNLHLLPGGMALGNRVYMHAELAEGVLHLSDKGIEGKTPIPNLYGFFLKESRDCTKVYSGMGKYKGIGIITKSDLEAGKPNWKFIDAEKGMRLMNVLTITEDPKGRLWFGRVSQGWGVYYPDKDTAITFLRQEGTSPFGAMATYCDKQGSIWLGGSDGLWVSNGNKTGTIQASDVIRLNHPLLPTGTEVVSMVPWRKFLIFTAKQGILLLDLEHFYRYQPEILSGKTTPSIQYINPHELSLKPQAQWYQNCLLTDKTDSSLWVAANDNVYQIDLKTWLSLKRPHARPQLMLVTGNDTLAQSAGIRITVPPTQNSLSFNIRYQTTDNLPRLMQVALVAKGDTARWSSPSTETHFEAWNKQTGEYQFLVRVIEHDGSINEFSFPITIRRFLWQQWWFWLLVSAAIIGVSVYLIYLHKQKQLAEANAARIAAEADALKAEQQRQLTAMQVKSLSTQFRPHFILNALNTIGAQLYDKPEVDAVLGQLGDSISIIFRNAQAGNIAHTLAQEWQLVNSVINIKQMEMRHTVKVHQQVPENIYERSDILMPMGLLQIPVENALVHGLRNKETGSKDLWLEATETEDHIHFSITDNGIGRKAAALISNYRRNGVGTRNLMAIIDLLNQHNEQPITYTIEDTPIMENKTPVGTQIHISVPKHFRYDI